MLPLLATHLLKKVRWSAPEPLALPAAGLPGSRGGNSLAMSALHFFATSTDIAEARSGAATSAAPINASHTPAKFDLTNINAPRSSAATSAPCPAPVLTVILVGTAKPV